MRHPYTTYCPFCAEEILEAEFLCKHCGRDLHALRIATLKAKALSKAKYYEIVPDGRGFGVALSGIILIHGMNLEKAQSTAKILNEVLQATRA